MKIPSRAFGFVRVGLQNSFGVTVPNFGTGGDYDNPLLNDVEAGDEAAGVEFCPVFGAQEASGTLAVRTDGGLSFVGAADGSYSIPYDLYTFTPGDGVAVDEGSTTFEVAVGAGASAVDLVIADSTHGHTTDAVALTTDSTLTVADAAHAHTADAITLALASESTDLTIADATHGHAADAVELTADSTLAIADVRHLHRVDSLVLSIPGAFPDVLSAFHVFRIPGGAGSITFTVPGSAGALTYRAE